MDKDDILEKSRVENNYGTNDDYQKEVRLKGFRIATFTVMALCLVFLCLEGYNNSYLVIANAVNAAVYTYQAVRLQSKNNTIVAVIWTVSTLIWFVLYILDRIQVL